MKFHHLIYWLNENDYSFCPEEIKDLINKISYNDKNFEVKYGGFDYFKESFEEVVEAEEIYLFPIFLPISEEKEEGFLNIFEELIKHINEYKEKGKLIHIIPLIFIKNEILKKLKKSISEQISSLGCDKFFIFTDKYRNNRDVALYLDWLVIFKNFVEFNYAYRSSYDLQWNRVQNTLCFGSLAYELPIRDRVYNKILELLKDFKEYQISPAQSSFDFNTEKVLLELESEISNNFQEYKLPPDIINPFNREPEAFFHLLPEKHNIRDIMESDYETKAREESASTVENLFKNIYKSIVEFSSKAIESFGEKLEPLKEKVLSEIRSNIVRFLENGGNIYTLESHSHNSLKEISNSLSSGDGIFQAKKIIEYNKNFFAPNLKELCKILLNIKIKEKFSYYVWILFGIFIFLLIFNTIFAKEIYGINISFRSIFIISIFSAFSSLIITFLIREIVLYNLRKKANKILEILAGQFEKLKIDFSDKISSEFRKLTFLHFKTKINITISGIIMRILEICGIYRKVFECQKLKPFSISQSTLLRYCNGKEIPYDEIKKRVENNFNKNKKIIFSDFISISSENQVEKIIINFLQSIEENTIKESRNILKAHNFDLGENDIQELLVQTKEYITCLLPTEIEKEEGISTYSFLCLPTGLNISNIQNCYSTNWERTEGILAVTIISGIKNVGRN